VIAVLLLGLLAGGVSCAAVQGGLLAGLVSRQRGTAATAPTVGDDLAPVGGFLAGKLVSHALLGLLLGGIGSVVQLSLHARTLAQLAAGLLIVVLGLAQLGVPGLRRVAFEPPAAWGRFVRGRARGMSVFSPGLLGLASVLIPCGVTISVMALAITTGSPWQGAALMAVFVAGTAPLFAILGYAAARARRAAGPWRQRLATLTGLAVLAAGLFTVNGGLELAGSPIAASQIGQLWSTSEPAPTAPASIVDGQQQVIVTAVTDAYLPGDQVVMAGIPTTLIVRSQQARGCIREFVIPSMRVEKLLPSNGDTVLALGPLKPGRLRLSCGMGMYTATLTVKEPTA
jgi:sulfite exporter TauE/SafE